MSDRSAACKIVDRKLWQRLADAATLPEKATILVIGGEDDDLDELLAPGVRAQYIDADEASGHTALTKARKNSLDAVLCRDVLWRLKDPSAFFEQVLMALKPGGRVALLEPGITPMSWLCYSLGPNARMAFDIDPLASDQRPCPNQALPSVLFTRLEHKIAFQERFPAFRTVEQCWLNMLAGPLSDIRSGFSVIPEGAVDNILKLEDSISPFLARWLSFRLFVVLEKRSQS